MWYDGRSNLAPMELTENGPWSLAEYWREKGSYAADCVLELRARVEALEREAAMNELRAASAEVRPADDEAVCPYVRTGDEGTSYCALAEQVAARESSAPPASSPVEPSDIFPTEYADSDGGGIRIIMEPADETGRVCWVVRNSRHVNPCHEFPTPEAAYAAHKSASAPQTVATPTPASSLVERVAGAIDNAPYDEDRHQWDEARAAIREVVDWLDQEGIEVWAVERLQVEVNRG